MRHRVSQSGLRVGATAASIVLSLAALLSADSASSAVDVSALVRLTSNYEYRGYSLSNNDAAVQANIDAAWSNGFSLGSWISSADFGGADLAVNPYLGKSFTLSPDWQVVTLVAGHFFHGKVSEYNTSYDEYEKVDEYNASYGEGALQLDYRDLGSAQVSISPDYYGTGETVLAYESELRYPLSDTIEVSGGLGYQASRDALNHDVLYANVGIAWFVLPHLTLDLRYHDLHEMNERPYWNASTDPLAEYRLDTPVVLSVSIGL